MQEIRENKTTNISSVKKGLNIDKDQHVFIAGKTGSGKTTLAMFLLFQQKRLIIVDSKDGLPDWNTEENSEIQRIKLKEGKPVRIRVVNNAPALELLELAYQVGDVTIYIDEMAALVPPRSKAPQVIYDILQRGRGRNISVWTSTQRPTLIPLESMSEATHLFIFRLNLEKDRKTISSNAGIPEPPPVKDQHGFYYWNDIDSRLRYFKRLSI